MSSDFEGLFDSEWKPEDERPFSRENSPGEPENRVPRALHEKEVKVIDVFEGVVSNPNVGSNTGPPPQTTTFVLLRDNKGRDLRIFVVRDVAYAISLAVKEENPDRPYTHDLMRTMLERLGAKIERVIIDDLWQDTFYAKIYLQKQGVKETLEIDARPSDAIALALRFRSPIYVAEAVLESAQSES